MKIYNKKDINYIIICSNIVKDVLLFIKKYIKPGISTGEINDICHDRIVNYHKAYPASLGYMNYPKSICTSINNVVCHGIPDYSCILKNGDIINIDIGIRKYNYYSDSSRMYFVGKPSVEAKKLCIITYKSIFYALNFLKFSRKISIIGCKIQEYVERYGYSVVRDYCGHGIGKNFHEFPQILHFKNNCNIFFRKGMVFTIEPMINIGCYKTIVMNDGWTVKTLDGSLSAQYEHTILITDKGYKILT